MLVGQEFQSNVKLFEVMVGVADKMGREHEERKRSKGGVLWSSSFLTEGVRLLKKLDLQRTPLAKINAMLVVMSCFHSCLKFSTGGDLVVV